MTHQIRFETESGITDVASLIAFLEQFPGYVRVRIGDKPSITGDLVRGKSSGLSGLRNSEIVLKGEDHA